MATKEILGRLGTDKVTGFKGTIIGISHWLTGCDQIFIKPDVLKDGLPQSAQNFDEGTVIIGKVKVTPEEVEAREEEYSESEETDRKSKGDSKKKKSKPGGPNDDAKKAAERR